jgi:cell fate (sporulation/competence/biofilm development) regulator YlbF (YheA/YmcA/DUF963 family)
MQAQKDLLDSHEKIRALKDQVKSLQQVIYTKIDTKLPAAVSQLVEDPQVLEELKKVAFV